MIGGDLDSPRVGLVSMNMLSSLSVVARSLPAKRVCGSAALKRLLHLNLLDRPLPAEAPGEFEERGRQVLARLADGERGDERGGAAIVPAFPYDQPLQRLSLPMDGWWWQHLKHIRQLQLAALYARLGPMGTWEQTGSPIA